MRKLAFLGAAAIIASTAAFSSMAHAACAQFDPNCATYPMPTSGAGGTAANARAEASRADTGSYQRHHRYRSASRADRAAQRAAVNNGYYNNGYYRPGPERSGFWPGDVAGAAIGTAGNIAAGAVNTAGAIATAPFRGADSYAYYNNGWPQQSYAERNGFACTPGTYFRSPDGVRHLCQ